MEKSPEEQQIWYAQLPRFYGAAGLYLTDELGRVLLVKPNYRDYWQIPGGIIEKDEYPHEACAREIREELGLSIKIDKLLVIDWAHAAELRPHAIINFIFDGGVIADQTQIQLQIEELDEYLFVETEKVGNYLPEKISSRVPAAQAARLDGKTRYLPDGFEQEIIFGEV